MAEPHYHEDVHTHTDDGSSAGVLMALIIFAALLFLFFYFGLPALNRVGTNNQPQLNVPSKVDVNVQPK